MRLHEVRAEEGGGVSTSDEDGLLDMANLGESKTGVSGTIHISTSQGPHGPRVKYFPGRPGDQVPSLSVSISDQPALLYSNLPGPVERRALPRVQAWVRLNHVSLLAFWQRGTTWMDEEVDAFKASLARLP